jgi:YidC/Oxa1 family membrane protein insertase
LAAVSDNETAGDVTIAGRSMVRFEDLMGQKRFLPWAIGLGAIAAWLLAAPHLRADNNGAASAPAATLPTATQAAALAGTATQHIVAGLPAVGSATAPAIAASDLAFSPEEKWTLGSATGSDYNMQIKLSNAHAAVEEVVLNQRLFSADVQGKKPEVLLDAAATGVQAFATSKITLGGDSYPLLVQPDGKLITWHVDRDHSDANHVTFYLIFTDPKNIAVPRARLEKTYAIKSHGDYLLEVAHRVINLTDAPLTVALDQSGPTSLYNHPQDDLRQDTRAFQAATFNKPKQYINGSAKYVRQAALASATDSSPLGSFGYEGTDERLVWIASNKRFFTVLVRPEGADLGDRTGLGKPIDQANYIAGCWTHPVIVDHDHPEASLAEILFVGAGVTVPPHGAVTMPMEIYVGPKDRHSFAGDIAAPVGSFAEIAATYRFIDLINFSQGGFCGFLTFTWIAMLILWLLQLIHVVIPNYGVAIILLVIVIRLCLHPLTRRGQTSMARMQAKMAKAQPELDRIKKKYAKDPAQQRTEQMRIFKEYDVNPAGQVAGCAPMLVQTPIWIALYAGLAVDIDLRHATFIPGWINDLANPDMVIGSFDHPLFTIPILHMPIFGLNILPLLLGVVFFLNMKFQTKNAPKPSDESQAQVQKFSQYMILIIPIFLYNAASGLNLYMFASTLGGIFDTWIVRKHLRREGLMPAAAVSPL